MFKANFQTYDRNNKPTSMSWGVGDTPNLTNVGDLGPLLDALVTGSTVGIDVVESTSVVAAGVGPSADANAQRQNKWIFRFQVDAGATLEPGKIYHHFFGTADNSVLPSSSSDFVDLTAGVGLAFKAKADLVWKSPLNEAGALVSVQNTDD